MKTNFVGGPFHFKVFLGKRQGLPATVKTLRTTLATLFKPVLADSELDALA